MLETLWLRFEVENKLLGIFLISFVLSTVMVWFSKVLLPLPTGVTSVFLVSLAAAYPVVSYLKQEEESESAKAKRLSEKTLLKRHERELGIYIAFFLGVTSAYIIMSAALSPSVFEAQGVAMQAAGISGQVTGGLSFASILFNNLVVFGITFALSLLISAGTVFILVWNASILGIFLSSLSDNVLYAQAQALIYLPHGLLEIGGYILAGIAASLLAYQLDRKIRGKHSKKSQASFPKVLEDCTILTLIGFGMVLLGTVIEVI